jgi:DNA invertase Pin-like site-specific DNA recombinase
MTKRSRTRVAEPREVKRCAIYTRKSVARGLDQAFNSLDAQRETCEQYVGAQASAGWEVLPERYDDGGYTGKNTDRPGFQRLMADVDAGKLDIVVVYKIDRLSRSLLDFAQIMARFDRAGVAFVSVTQHFNTADAIGRLTLNLLMSFAEFEREQISERTRDKIAATKRRGQWTGGPAPFGYRLVDKKLVVDEERAAIVRELFVLYTEQRSTRLVAEQLNARRAGDREWSKVSVLNTLRNPVYAGVIVHGNERHLGRHERIVETALFERVGEMLDAAAGRPRSAPRNSQYLLTGLLRCGSCGGAMTSASTYRRGREYRYYRCTTRDKKGRSACSARPLAGGAIEAFVVDRIRESAQAEGFAEEVQAQLASRIETRRAALQAERAELPKRVGRLSTNSHVLLEKLMEASAGERAAIEERLAAVRDELDRTEHRLHEVEHAVDALSDTEHEVEAVARLLRDFDPVWNALTPENRARLVHELLEYVEFDSTSGEVAVCFAPLRTLAGEAA